MKKTFLKRVSAIILAAVMSITTVSAASAEKPQIEVKTLGDRVCEVCYRNDFHWEAAWELRKSRSVKGSEVLVDQDETLIIPSGVALNLYNGAEILGSVYIEEGGRLSVMGGTVTVSSFSSIYSDGKITVNKNARLFIGNYGCGLYVSQTGEFREGAEGVLELDTYARAVCLGRTNSTNEKISRKFVNATHIEGNHTVVDRSENVLPDKTKFDNDNCVDYDHGGEAEYYFNFEKNTVIRANMCGGKFHHFGNTFLGAVGSALYPAEGTEHSVDLIKVNGTNYAFDAAGGYFEYNADNEVTRAESEKYSAEEFRGILEKLTGYKLIGTAVTADKQKTDVYRLPDGALLAVFENNSVPAAAFLTEYAVKESVIPVPL